MNEDMCVFLSHLDVLPPKARVELLQMVCGDRPVAQITVLKKFRSRMLPAVCQLQGMGFALARVEREKAILEFYVSRNAQLSQEAAICTDIQRFGELMGFPPSAIEAYVKGQEHLLAEQQVEDLIGFPNHVFWLKFSKLCPGDAVMYLRRSYKLLLESAEHLLDDMLPEEGQPELKKKIRRFVYE